jgi:signal transduction histidine kinase
MINKNTNKKNNTNKKDTMTIKNNTMTQEMQEFVEYFKDFYDTIEPVKSKFITTDMIVDEAEFLIEEDAAGNYVWCEGDSDDRATVYANIIDNHFKTEAK